MKIKVREVDCIGPARMRQQSQYSRMKSRGGSLAWKANRCWRQLLSRAEFDLDIPGEAIRRRRGEEWNYLEVRNDDASRQSDRLYCLGCTVDLGNSKAVARYIA